MTGAVTVTRAGERDRAEWETFVGAHGQFYQRPGWGDVISSVYGHEPVCLIARQGGEVTGVLPMVDRRSALFGKALISMGFTVGGGVTATDQASKEALLDAAITEGKSRGSDYVELRSENDHAEGWFEKTGIYDTFSTPLIEDHDARLKSIPRKKRADIRKGIGHGESGALTIRVADDYDLFWQHYALAQRDHGTPVFPRRWLTEQKKLFRDAMELVFVEHEGEPLAGVVNYYHRQTVHLYSSFISPSARRFHAGDYLYWWMMGHGLERGATEFDLGRSKQGTGPHAYKTYWGIEPRPLGYLYKLMKTDEMPNVNPQNPKFALMSKVWTRLPVPVANRLGPVLAGHLA